MPLLIGLRAGSAQHRVRTHLVYVNDSICRVRSIGMYCGPAVIHRKVAYLHPTSREYSKTQGYDIRSQSTGQKR